MSGGAAPRVLELYAGIGGAAEAARGLGVEVVAAIEQSPVAIATYRANHPHEVIEKNLTGRRVEDLLRFDADVWWMSPPCQPFTVRGKREDLDDARARTLTALIGVAVRARPRAIAFENVPGFAGSDAHGRVRAALEGAGYAVSERVLCPTELGIPNRRRRFYLVAGPAPVSSWPDPGAPPLPLSSFLDVDPDPALVLSPDLARAYREPMHVVDDPSREVTECFTAAYGRSHVFSGSFLRHAGGVRRFSPREVARLLGLRESFVLPADRARAYELLGSSLSVPAARAVLSAAIALAGAGA